MDERHSFSVSLSLIITLVKPIVQLSWRNHHDEKALRTSTLTVIENTFETVHCVISANPSARGNIQWFANDQLIPGKGASSSAVHTIICLARGKQMDEEGHRDTFEQMYRIHQSFSMVHCLFRRESRADPFEFHSSRKYSEAHLSNPKFHWRRRSVDRREHSL